MVDYASIRRKMVSYWLNCHRIVERREAPQDREALAKFGEEMWHWARLDLKYSSTGKEDDGIYRCCVVLRAGKRGLQEPGELKSVKDIADALKLAQNPEMFDRHAASIGKFLDECAKEADEIVAVGGLSEDIFAVVCGGMK